VCYHKAYFVTERWFFIIVISDDGEGYPVRILIVVMPFHKPDSQLALKFKNILALLAAEFLTISGCRIRIRRLVRHMPKHLTMPII
jgi:hypothetical protein